MPFLVLPMRRAHESGRVRSAASPREQLEQEWLLLITTTACLLDRIWILKRVGCEALAERVRELAPALHVFGHIHEGRGQARERFSLQLIGAFAALAILLAATFWCLAAGVFSQILWDDQPITAPLSHRRWRDER